MPDNRQQGISNTVLLVICLGFVVMGIGMGLKLGLLLPGLHDWSTTITGISLVIIVLALFLSRKPKV